MQIVYTYVKNKSIQHIFSGTPKRTQTEQINSMDTQNFTELCILNIPTVYIIYMYNCTLFIMYTISISILIINLQDIIESKIINIQFVILYIKGPNKFLSIISLFVAFDK